MKRNFTLFSRVTICVFSLLTLSAASLFSQTITFTPSGTQNIVAGTSISFTADPSGNTFNGNGNFTYTWSAPGLTIPGANPVTAGGGGNTKTINFPSEGTYTVSCTVSRGSSTVTQSTVVNVFLPNLYSTSGTGTIKGYNINPVTGTIIFGPADIITPNSSTAGLGKNRANVNDANGNLYYILNTNSNSGVVTIYSVNPDGTSNTNVGTIDMNGAANNTSLGFVRLGFDGNGKGWILAGDGSSNIYIASFQGNGNNPISNVNTYGNTGLSFNGGGSAAEFQNGDLAVGPNGVLYAMANITGGETYIYTLNSLVTPTTLTRKWTVQTGGAAFTGTSVNGIAWTQTGSMHISTSNGIYFVDQTTVNSVNSTVQAVQILSLTGLTDLASSEFPLQSTLPVTFGEVAVKKSGANAEISWSTLSETNNDHFIVERSDDALNFKSIGTVAGQGNTTLVQRYSYADAIGSSTGVIYYRIKQVDADGKGSYSKTVSLRIGGARISNFTAYPNPFVSNIKIQVDASEKEELVIRVNSLNGQTLITKRTPVQKGNNIIVIDNLQQLQPGIYMLEVVAKDGKHTQRLIKN